MTLNILQDKINLILPFCFTVFLINVVSETACLNKY